MFVSRLLIILATVAIGIATPTVTQQGGDSANVGCVKNFAEKASALNEACKILTPSEAENFGTEAAALSTTLNQCTTTLKNTAGILSDSDCTEVYVVLTGSVATSIGGLLNCLTSDVPFFAKVGATANVGIALKSFDFGCSNYIEGLIQKCPKLASKLADNEAALKTAIKKCEAKFM
ncbi:hypothetical protein B0H19DRAFT_1255350 [Mycena capillaripes]|nr:hypothetical protein B0H19DRAFT_1255350 [Mycena capillaripes]